MTRPTRITFTHIAALLFLLLLSGSKAYAAEQEVITIDGREILLKEDGTWAYRSNDRFANTKNGHRVLLKEDGTWQYVGNAPMASVEQVKTRLLDIKLQKVVIEKHEKKVHKNVRVTTQTVFYVSLDLSPLAKSKINISKNDITFIKVEDNNGKSYPVISIQPSPMTIQPNSNTTIVIRADGAPLWLGNVKTMSVILKPEIFGIQEPITLSQKVNDFDEKKVDGFDKNK